MKKKIIGILVMTQVLFCAFSTANMIENENNIGNDKSSETKLDSQERFVKIDFKPKAELITSEKNFLKGNNTKYDNISKYTPPFCNVYEDHEPPWGDSYAWADPLQGSDTYMDKETGVGRVYPAQIPNLKTMAGAGIKDQYYVYTGNDVQGAVILKEPSWVSMDIYPAGICKVCIGIDEYDPNTGELTYSWEDEVVSGDYTGYLNDVGVQCEFHSGYIYGVTCGGLVIRDNDAAGAINELRVKKIRWGWIDGDYEVEIKEPKGGIYFNNINIYTIPGLSFAIMLFCRTIKCVAETTNTENVDHVTFICDEKTVTDDSPSGNTWSASLSGINNGLKILRVEAYDTNNMYHSDYIKIYKIG